MSHDPLDRLYGRLAEAVRRSAPDSPARPFTIADIYQHLVPYRAVRNELGFAELQEYEHTLLRLFAGERGYVHVEVPQVAEEFKRELRSPNPILGIYRDYAAVDVTVDTGASGAGAESAAHEAETADAHASEARAARLFPAAADSPAAPSPPASEPASKRPLWSAAELEAPSAAPAPERAPARLHAVEPESQHEPEPETAPEPTTCWHCRERLPQGREVRFCPHCGIVQVATPCDDCGAPVEPSWKFCVLCGTARTPQPMAAEA